MKKKYLIPSIMNPVKFLLLVQIILLAVYSPSSQAKNELQLRLGDSVSIFSEKAYRRDNGTYFEAIGNVIIISGNDTLYGEKASLNSKTGEVDIEGSVRFIGKNMTIYGSKIHFNTTSGYLEMYNARMITDEFSIVANKIIKKSETLFSAFEAEFTTCRDCKESWLVSGSEIYLEINRYVKIHHALAKVKGVGVLYLPYIALPVKSKRESGLLFPKLESKVSEGLIYEQPIFWAIDESRDATLTPLFLTERGVGFDLQYRQIFGEKNWVEFNSKVLSDKAYDPDSIEINRSGTYKLRNFYELESHTQWNNSLSHHFLLQKTKDLDFFSDYSDYSEEKLLSSDIGADFFINKRFEEMSLGLEANYKRNILYSETLEFDKSYVQTLPSVKLSVMPQILYQEDRGYLHRVSYGFDTDFTAFKQDNQDDSLYIRNARRLNVNPFMDVSLLNAGPVTLKTKVSVDYQDYNFYDKNEPNFYKHSTLVSTEFNFTMDRIYGLSYEEKYSIDEFREQDLIKFKPHDKNIKNDNLIGTLPSFEGTFAKEELEVKSFSYRHSQEFKFIHHQLVKNNEVGNQRFLNQIQNESGWFDYKDAIIEKLDQLDSNETRTSIPLKNTFEFQWNNSLIKKSPLNYRYLIDEKYLKDNFSYAKIGYFNISQGYVLSGVGETVEDRLTRLFLETGYNMESWSIGFSDYYFHQSSNNILQLNTQKRFDSLSLLAVYNQNTFESSKLRTLSSGFQLRPHDTIGFSYLKDFDFIEDESTTTIYQVDLMPHNNCWIISLNYKDKIIEQRYALNFEFNFGTDDFKEYKSNFFSFDRLR